jgi:hypothetical protein
MIEERIKKVVDNLKAVLSNTTPNLGKVVREFHKEFEEELCFRGGIVHHEPFDHMDIDLLFIANMIAASPNFDGMGWQQESLKRYQKFALDWSRRAKQRSADMQIFTERVALLLLENAKFLGN